MAMQQPPTPNAAALPPNPFPSPPPLSANSSPGSVTTTTTTNKSNRRAPPGPEEVLAHYESQGLSPREASLRAIRELQAILFRYATKKERFAADSPRKLDGVNTRLAVLEMKLDSKPGFPESLAIGVASGAIVSAIPHVLGGLRGIWDSVWSATKGSPPSL
ncbi:hypothetical protein BHE74_00043224 [Ensete ventricosum]|nr:hypothetical protein BHE74_00043224 [Ensete ventricosum]RZR97872.1 hypothetical protein BHM03_00027126 [Ensete ventricosum]